MDVGRAVYTLVEVYVTILVILSLATIAWLFNLFEEVSVRVAGVWFAVSGFGFLVLLTILLIHLTRE